MTLPTGQIGISDVNSALGYTSTSQRGLNDSKVRTLAQKTSGQIAMSDLRGKKAGWDKARIYITTQGYKSSGDITFKLYSDSTLVTEHGGTITNGSYLDITWSIPEVIKINRILGSRMIDTNSSGNAVLNVYLYRSYDNSWHHVYQNTGFRTGTSQVSYDLTFSSDANSI
jgi:hypothetical protein